MWYSSLLLVNDLARDCGGMWCLPHQGIMYSPKNNCGGLWCFCQLWWYLTEHTISCYQIKILVVVLMVFGPFLAQTFCLYDQLAVHVLSGVDQKDLLTVLLGRVDDVDQNTNECRMHAHISGASSSPVMAKFALHKTALENAADSSPTAMETAHCLLCVDNCLFPVWKRPSVLQLTFQFWCQHLVPIDSVDKQ